MTLLIDIDYPIFSSKAEQEEFIVNYLNQSDYKNTPVEYQRQIDKFLSDNFGSDISNLKTRKPK